MDLPIGDYLTRDNITLVLSIFGAAGTFISTINAILRNRKKIVLTVLGYRFEPRIYTFCILFENKSRLPISINQLSLVKNSKCCRCVLISKTAIEITRTLGGEVIKQRDYNSADFPINLPGLTSHSALVLFEPLEPLLTAESKSVILEVSTNRGKASQIELSLADAFDPFEVLI